MRDTYARIAKETGVAWSGRSYQRDAWDKADPVNRALSTANSCLYGICHAAIVSAGFSPALGFIHTGKMLSFVYDVAYLYKTEVTVPIAFRAVAQPRGLLERHVRLTCRDQFVSTRLLERIIPDIQSVLMMPKPRATGDAAPFDRDAAAPGFLWDPAQGDVRGGRLQPFEIDDSEADDGGPDS